MALGTLSAELNPDWVLPDASPAFRERLALALFYKFVLNTVPTDVNVNPKFKSGGTLLQRPLSSGIQTFHTVEKVRKPSSLFQSPGINDLHVVFQNYPLTQPVMKLEALMQTSGEATYQNDTHHRPYDLWCAFVLATEANSTIIRIDATPALVKLTRK